MVSDRGMKAELYTRYPLSSVLTYNGVTILHFLLGGIGILLGYGVTRWTGIAFASLYVVASFAVMYLMMPLTVCPSCVYYRLENAVCISGLNILSRRIARERDPKAFARRGEGLFCHNNLYIAALVIPVIAILPALVSAFSGSLLAIELALVGLLLYRFFVVFPRVACLHCRAKHVCPQAEPMGVRER